MSGFYDEFVNSGEYTEESKELHELYDVDAKGLEDFPPLPAGEYEAEIIAAYQCSISRNDPRKGTGIKIHWAITQGEYEGRIIFQSISTRPQEMKNAEKVRNFANAMFATIREAINVQEPKTYTDLCHKKAIIKLAVREDPTGKYSPSNEVKKVYPIKKAVDPFSDDVPF